MPQAILKIHQCITYDFEGTDLTKAREELGLTEEEFANKCGWSQQYQSQLEIPGIKHRLSFKRRLHLAKGGIIFIH